MDKWAKLKSFSEESMPGCLGDFGNPIEGWLQEGMTCEKCFWRAICGKMGQVQADAG